MSALILSLVLSQILYAFLSLLFRFCILYYMLISPLIFMHSLFKIVIVLSLFFVLLYYCIFIQHVNMLYFWAPDGVILQGVNKSI